MALHMLATNFTDPAAAAENSRYDTYVHSGILFGFFTLALTGNSAIVGKLWYHGKKTLHKMSNVTLLCFNLALADLLAAFCCILSNAILYLVETFSAGNVTCKLLRFFQRLGLVASTFIVVTISVDRCAAVWFPMRRSYLWRTRVLFMLGIWLLAACFSFPQMTIFKVTPGVSQSGTDIFECSGFDEFEKSSQEIAYDIMSLLFFYVIPLAAIIASYSLILAKINQTVMSSPNDGQLLSVQHDSMSWTAQGKRHALYLRARNTSLVISLVVVATFVACWAPYYISLIIHLVTQSSRAESYYYSHAIYFCGLGHSVLNPIIYGAFHVIKRSRSAKTSSQFRSSEYGRNSRHSSSASRHGHLTVTKSLSLGNHTG